MAPHHEVQTIQSFLVLQVSACRNLMRFTDFCPATTTRFAWATFVALKQAVFYISGHPVKQRRALLESNSPRDSWICDGMAGRLLHASRVLFPFHSFAAHA